MRSHTLTPSRVRPASNAIAPISQILFGSDFPNIPYPYRHAVESIVGLGLGDDWCRKVLSGNAQKLFAPVGAGSGD